MRKESEKVHKSLKTRLKTIVKYLPPAPLSKEINRRTAVFILFTVFGILLGEFSQRWDSGRMAQNELYLSQNRSNNSEAFLNVSAPKTEEAAKSAEEEQTEEVTEEVTAEEEQTPDNIPSLDKLNLAYCYPDGSSQDEVIGSYAGQVFRNLLALDSEWLADIYELADVKPASMAAMLGKNPMLVMGKYNPKDKTHDPDRPDTWKINGWKKINVSFTDGNGRKLTELSNDNTILAMASVYTYYTDMMDTDAFETYARQLWKNSHSYHYSISDVYYCDGCMEPDNEAEEETHGEEPESSVPSHSIDEQAELTDHPSVSAESGGETGENKIELSQSGGEDVLNRDNPLQSGESQSQPIQREEYQGPEKIDLKKSGIEVISSIPSSLASFSNAYPSAGHEFPDCPGHIDLNIQIRIWNFEGKNNLISRDEIGKNISEQSGWPGWNEENIKAVNLICSQDLFSDYGLSLSSVSTNVPLSPQEIQEYMDQLPDDLSQTRKDIIYFALSSVGKVPYYWGGKASRPGYEGNRFGTLVNSDEKGRFLKGLDCSGWIQWVYWSATGKRPEAASTGSLVSSGEGIRRSELKPGDIVVRTGDDAHVVMFLSWSADGRMTVIHESSAFGNNVSIKTMDAAWPYYRRLVD